MTEKRFFDSLTTLEALKKEYRRLAMIFHPDCGGTDADMQELNRQYEEAQNRIKYAAPAGSRDAESSESSAEFVAIIDLLIRLHLDVELCGSWLWIGGDTKPVKDQLKAAGCRWASKKGLWYWHPADEGCSRSRKGGMDMSYIRDKYGSKVISGSNGYAVQAC